MLTELTQRHLPLISRAHEVLRSREHWSPYPEDPAAYGEQGAAEGERAFRERLGRPFDLDQPGRDGTVGPAAEDGGEVSPYGFPLGISYPHSDPAVLLPAMRAAMAPWRSAGPDARAAVCAEILARLASRSHELARAAMHTSGHNPVMAFHAGAAHALDRGLEAVAQAHAEQTRLPAALTWRKPLADGRIFALDKSFSAVPRGISLLVAGSVFPTWNGYPGLFASLATGNAVLVKPHPRAVLPLALTVRTAREVLREAGFSPDLVALAPERPGEYLAKRLAVHPDVAIVDYAGTTAFGGWLTVNATQAQVYTSTSAVNTLLVESTPHYRDMLDNLAFSLALYSGQLCTSPQNILVPRDGIATDQGHKTFDEVLADLGAALDRLLADDAEAAAVLGALYAPHVRERVEFADSGRLGTVAHHTRAVVHPDFPDAVVRTPVLLRLDAARDRDRVTLAAEWPGPVVLVAAVDSARDGVALIARTVRHSGALSVGAYTTSPAVERALEDACADSGVMLSLNLTGDWYLTQSAVYSDLHGTGLNPAGNAAYCDAAFVANRFRTVAVRRKAADGFM
ncbi:phenylacetic acid degradation protein PaaN [Streptomyces sp. NBC_01408]|uniref:phenylacetic acid degradation protein PaaN n=1 Tax=Streptomyces sp. NBC_01408 TaxID=2903855 RepID=UPI00224F74AC|nr:phenylacetic acid degradation protein PaaN [Streptomyces sp. NBC_01408]MCX4695326.1 phenylacetic acid degradation protein PaaN [Streptomyces sp. NBC_01408]